MCLHDLRPLWPSLGEMFTSHLNLTGINLTLCLSRVWVDLRGSLKNYFPSIFYFMKMLSLKKNNELQAYFFFKS